MPSKGLVGRERVRILPYTKLVGQERLKLALELAYIAPGIGGVLLSGERGTAKSTAVRAFAQMVYGGLPVTLPINATEDRVVGGWKIEKLLQGKSEPRPGLLEEANQKLLYVDEVNLLDDHVVNLILDVASTGVLDVQREGLSRTVETRFTLVGTMNPEEGILRPQLLDRFGLVVAVTAETDAKLRAQILRTMLEFDDNRRLPADESRRAMKVDLEADAAKKKQLDGARSLVASIGFSGGALERCITLVQRFNAQGHRGEQAMALAARAYVARALAAREQRVPEVTAFDVHKVAGFAIPHRRPRAAGDPFTWTDADARLVETAQT